MEVLSQDPIPDEAGLGEVIRNSIEGDYSMQYERTQSQEISGKTAAMLLVDQGSDPEFFGIDEEGKPIDD